MRKYHHRMMLELLEMINESQSAGAYAECQQSAIGIGQFIESESDKGEGARTVALLVEYCELLFKASNGEIGKKALKKHLALIENSIRTELKPNRIEIAFLSYKASMSDSIESIYLAAKADPDCDAYWIPIPYFDRNPDGSHGDVHYEGAGFYGKNIECTNWRKYDIEARHPDVIFTFNPYDAGNYVTAVHPDFYCERLRNLTDCLIYVPYFVTGDGVLEHHQHFCVAPGCVYAHKVIVQSEEVRDAYIRVFEKHYGNRLGKPEDKFVALGSPKFDKVINSKRRNFKLPDEWTKLIGSKKVIFWNTTVGAILQGNEQYLKKLRYVLNIFRNRDDVVLWWRPHPLNEATYHSMRPQLFSEYKQIISEYKNEGWGIYDDSHDLHRAITWTDAYYGDGSSVIVMYGVAGKPIMLQIPEKTENTHNIDGYPITFENLVEEGNNLWFAASGFNALFKMNNQTWKAEYMGSFPNHGLNAKGIISLSTQNGGKLYFAPYSDNVFYAYDLQNQSFETLPIDIDTGKEVPNYGFFSIVSYDNYIFYIGCRFRGIVRYNTKNGETTCCDEWANKADELMDAQDWKSKAEKRAYFAYVCVVGNKLYCPLLYAKTVLVFDMDTCKYELYELNSNIKGFRDIAYDGTSFWLAPQSDGQYLVRWNKTGNKIQEYEAPIDNHKGVWWGIAIGNNFALYLPLWCPYSHNTPVKIDLASDEITKIDQLLNKHLTEEDSVYYRYSVIGDNVYLYGYKTLLSLNMASFECRRESILLDKEQFGKNKPLLQRLLQRAFLDRINNCRDWKNCMIYESSGILNLNSYLDYIVSDRGAMEYTAMQNRQIALYKKTAANAEGTAGQRIYAYIKEQIKQGI